VHIAPADAGILRWSTAAPAVAPLVSRAFKFGIRARGTRETSNSPQNFAGTFAFGGGFAPELDAANQPVTDASGQPVLVNIESIERYRRTLVFEEMGLPASQIRALGGGGTQFSISTGESVVSASQVDVGAFAGDDWNRGPT